MKRLAGTRFKAPGVSTVQHDTRTSVYVPTYEDMTPEVLRQAAVAAGVTVYCQDAVVYANERLLSIHFAQGGERRVTLPSDCLQVRERYTGQVIPATARRFSYTFKTPDTTLFELCPTNQVGE